jgi:hypothetical protein
MEYWKPIVGYEGLYEVSSYGRVKSLPRTTTSGGILAQSEGKSGYLYVTLCKDNVHVSKQVHRLVAENFIRNDSNLPQVNHLDENPHNNRVDNLMWCTPKQNVNYGNCIAKRSQSNKKAVKQLSASGEFIQVWNGARDASKELGINYKNISACANGKRNYAGGFKWQFV